MILESEDETFHKVEIQDYKLTTIDNDVPPTLITLVMGEAIVTEQGGSAAISVQLSRQPQGEVLVPVAVSDMEEASLETSSLAFDTLTWNVPQQVIVTGTDDMKKDGDTMFNVTFGPANSEDEAFNGIGPFKVALTNIDGVCGNSVVDGDEPCEPDGSTGCPGGERTCMVCTNNCEWIQTDGSSFCGDGETQQEDGEECDEAERLCFYGEESCLTCRACKWVEGQVTGYCGDGMVQVNAGEVCDEPDQPCDYGEESCQTCRDCKRVTGDLTGYCGDGVVQMNDGEECDGDPQLNGVTCPRRQEGASCEVDCSLDATGCRNDNVVVAGGGPVRVFQEGNSSPESGAVV